MNKTLATFMGLALTAIVIVVLLFTGAYHMINTETQDYQTKDIQGHAQDLSSTQAP